MSYRWAVIIGLVSAVNSAAMLVSLSVGIMLPDIKEEFTLNPAQAGALGSVSPLATILLSVPLAALISRFNPRLMIFAGAVHMAVFGLLMAWAPSYELTLIFRFIFMIGLVGRQASMAMLIHQWFVAGEVARASAIACLVASERVVELGRSMPWLSIRSSANS